MPTRPSTSSSSQDRGYENSTQLALRKSSCSLPKLTSFFRRISSPSTSSNTSTTISSTNQTQAKTPGASRPVGISTTNSTTTTTTTTDNTNASRTSSVSTIGSLPQTTVDQAVADEEFEYKQIRRHHTPITLTAKEAKKLAKVQAKAMKLQREERKRA